MAEDTMPGIPESWVTAAITADIAGFRASRAVSWQSPSSAQVRRIAAAVLPLERERIAADLWRLAMGAAPMVERDVWLAARQVVLHGLAKRSDEKEASHG